MSMSVQHNSLAATGGMAGTGVAFFDLPFGWLILSVFVLAMAAVALATVAPRRIREVRKVNPPAVARGALGAG